MKKFLIGSIVFIFAGVVGFFGFQFFTHTGIFKVPGVVTYDESLTDEEADRILSIFSCDGCKDSGLDNDVKISGVSLKSASVPENSILYDIYVPVADFYDPRSSVSLEEAEPLLISIRDLDSTKKLLAIDGEYYLDTFSSGATFRYLAFEGKNPQEAIDRVTPMLRGINDDYQYPSPENTLSFAQTGVTALSRGMLTKLNATGGDGAYFAENIKDFLSSKDLTHISNESSFTNYANAKNICADWRMLNTILTIGTDIVELTGNHNQDCGDTPAEETIDKYNELNIKTVGGGKTATEAAKPLEISSKGANITMLAYNYSTGGYTLDETPGANFYTEEKFISDISSAQSRGDFIIVDIQFNECANYDWEIEYTACDRADSSAARDGYTQSAFFKHLIDLGADIVIGTSAHQAQTYELYGNGIIYYGLGNLFFDQIWWPGTTRSLIVTNYFKNGKLLQSRLTPTVFDGSMQTKLMDEETSRWFIDRLNAAR